MTFSLLLDIIEETYQYERKEDADQLYSMCFNEKSELLSYKEITKNFLYWIAECLDMWEIRSNTFRTSYISEILDDSTKVKLLIEHIYYYCQPEGSPPCDAPWIINKETSKNLKAN